MTAGVNTSVRAQTLCVVSHVMHYRTDTGLHAYEPYAREIEIWAELFERVIIAAPCRPQQPPAECKILKRNNITLHRLPENGGDTFIAKLRQIYLLPSIIRGIFNAMSGADAVHVRCPGNIGLLGVVLAPLTRKPRICKYAGQWNGYPGEPWTVLLQRMLLRSRWWNAPVTVYGEWPRQPRHIIPFFTSVLDAPRMDLACEASIRLLPLAEPRILFVGRLTKSKNVHVLLEALSVLRRENLTFSCDIAGDGPELHNLAKKTQEASLNGCIRLHGGLPFDAVLDLYKIADVLVLVSETEGWPKVIAEAMAHGLVCIGSRRGLIPHMLGDGRGILVDPGNVEQLADALAWFVRDPSGYVSMRKKAAAWAQRFTLESLRHELAGVIHDWWDGNPDPESRTGKAYL